MPDPTPAKTIEERLLEELAGRIVGSGAIVAGSFADLALFLIALELVGIRGEVERVRAALGDTYEEGMLDR